jgi:hypothetical protein
MERTAFVVQRFSGGFTNALFTYNGQQQNSVKGFIMQKLGN